MADFSAQDVKRLRDLTGAGMMDCKRALEATGGDMDAAVVLLRERSTTMAARKGGREAREGLIASYIHTGGRVGVLIEVNCETDFVARTDEFQKLARDLAIQVAGLSPRYVDVDHIPADDLEARRQELLADPAVQAKSADVRERIVDGQLKKWFRLGFLSEHPVRDAPRTVRELIVDRISTIGENIVVRRFTRYALGEDL
jgi:elongation factor Ts